VILGIHAAPDNLPCQTLRVARWRKAEKGRIAESGPVAVVNPAEAQLANPASASYK
jgi:hypothetical protein